MKELKDMTADELAVHFNEQNEAKLKAINEAIEAKATKEDISKLKEEYQEIVEKQLVALNKVLKEQGLAIQKMLEKPATEEKQTLKGLLESEIENLKGLKNKDKNAGFNVKVVGTMLESTNVTGDVPQSQREAGLNVIATRRPVLFDLIMSSVATSNVVSWVEQQNKEGAAAGTDEGALKNQIDFDIVVVEKSLIKRTAYIKVSKEMLEDIDFIEAEIRNELVREHNLDIENQILNGDGVAPNIDGLLNQATAFAAGTFANAINDANNWDVLKVAINQIMIAHFMPSVILMHPSDITEMNLTKGTDGHYVLPPFTSAEGLSVSGIRVVPSTVITVDNFLVMDGSRASAFWKNEREISVGFENDDFTKNLVTILIESRLLLRIKGNDTGAFVTGDFTTAKAALETP